MRIRSPKFTVTVPADAMQMLLPSSSLQSLSFSFWFRRCKPPSFVVIADVTSFAFE